MKKNSPLDEFQKVLQSSKVGKNKLEVLEKENKELKEIITRKIKEKQKIVVKANNKENKIKFAIVTDTHLGSMYEQIEYLKLFYKKAEDTGYNIILHAGDIIEGWKVYKGQEFEVHKRGWKEQREWFEDQYPIHNNIITKFITGNHDASFKKLVGIDVGPELCRNRKDFIFLGEDYGDVYFQANNDKEFKVTLLHPGGGSAYALSYRPQKIIEQLEGGTKPNMLIIGNFHKSELIPNYRNIISIQGGCFQSQTPFMKSKGLSAMMGGWFIDIDLNEDFNNLTTQFMAFYHK